VFKAVESFIKDFQDSSIFFQEISKIYINKRLFFILRDLFRKESLAKKA